jgi:hypothetical protein
MRRPSSIGTGLRGRGDQLSEIVRGGEETPLEPHLAEATKEKAAEAKRGLDLAEDGFDELLAQSIATATPCASQFAIHVGDSRPAGSSITEPEA